MLYPTLTEPYFNLAALRFREGKKPEARAFYRKAIENGAQPDLEFETELGS